MVTILIHIQGINCAPLEFFIRPQDNPLVILNVFSGSWCLPLGHTWPMGYCRNLRRMSVCLSIQFLLAYIHYWHQTITAYLPILVPHTIILALRPLTLAWWPLPWLCLLPQNYLNQTSHQYQNGTFAAFANILDDFEGQWPWWTFDQLFKVR